ncbi:MAG: hypothetical protein GY716_01990 [bacterium]|nr:hypothetical protein [bacterium]
MAAQIRGVEYFYAMVKDQPGEAYKLLAQLASSHVNLMAFNCVPMGPETQLMLFPETTESLAHAAQESGTVLQGPHRAFLVHGEDELGALAGIHVKLADAGVSVYSSNGVTDGKGGFGYVLFVRPNDYDTAAHALGV